MTLQARATHAYRLLIKGGELLQPVLLLAVRLYWGWAFFLAGKGKLLNLDKTTEFFSGLGIPLPKFNVVLASSTECVCGLLLLIGLASRLISLPLLFTLVIAYATADRESLLALWSDPDKFVTATPFLFLLACLIILAFGPGPFSVDHLLAKKFGANTEPGPTKPSV